jgi:hypothetical protein
MSVRRHAFFLVLAMLAAAPPSRAAGKVRIEMAELEFGGLAIEGLAVDWTATPATGALALTAARVRGLAATGPLSKFSLECPALRV